MKKLIILILLIIILSGCYKNKEKIKKESGDKQIENIVTKKYYSYIVPLYDHDDYNKENKNVNNLNYNNNYDILNNLGDEKITDNSIVIDDKKETQNNLSMKEDKENIATEENLKNSLEKDNDDKINNEKEEKILEENKEIDKELQSTISEDNNEELNEIKSEDNNEELNEIKSEDKKEELNDIKSEDNNDKLKTIYYSPSGKYLGTSNVKVIDVSYYQGNINWDLFAKESDCYGVILRLGYYTTLDKKFESYIKEIKRLNIPYGIYLFSYSKTLKGALLEANFVNSMIDKYNLSPNLGVFYDIESWSSKNNNSNDISKSMYDNIVQIFINKVSSHINYKYKVKVYSNRWYAMNRLGSIAKSYVDWVAEYNKTCKYDSVYSMWQYTSKARIPGISTYVDVSYILN